MEYTWVDEPEKLEVHFSDLIRLTLTFTLPRGFDITMTARN